jgi:hypothetical protein
MDIRKLQRVIVNALEDVKAQDIVVYNTKHLTSEFERVIIATGSSNRQTRALGHNVKKPVARFWDLKEPIPANGFLLTAEPLSYTFFNRPCVSTTTLKKSGAAKRSTSN